METHGHVLVVTPPLKRRLTKADRKIMDALSSQDPVQYSQALTYFKSANSHDIYDAKIEPQESLAGFASLSNFIKTRHFSDPVHLRLAALMDKSDSAAAKQHAKSFVEELDNRDLRNSKAKILSKWISTSGEDKSVYFQLELAKKTVIVGLQLHDGTQDCLTLTSKAHRPLLPEGADKSMIPSYYPFRSPISAPYLISYFYGPRIFNSMNLSIALEKTKNRAPASLPSGKTSPMKYLNKYWQFHSGVDFSVVAGTSVYAPYDGAVFALGKMGCAGNTLILAHALPKDGRIVFSVFEHLKNFGKILVDRHGKVIPFKASAKPGHGQKLRTLRIGDPVELGQVVAHSGASGTKIGFARGFKQGCVDGAHLHFEVRVPKDLSTALTRQIASVEGGRSLGEVNKRFRFVQSDTIPVNPADFVPGLDEACQTRKKAEIRNALALQKISTKKVPPLTAGLCGLKFETSLKTVPSLYRLTRTTPRVEDDESIPNRLAASGSSINQR